MKVPIISRFQPNFTEKNALRATRLAWQIRREHPQLDRNLDHFRNLVVSEPVENRPTLHLDDFSEIPVIGTADNSRILQQRARLRAFDGDRVAQSRTVERGFSDYCEYHLGLGRVHWLTPAVRENDTRQIALECWQDRRLRHELIQAIRRDGLRYIHPHISTVHVWELAALLSRATRLPVRVIGPTPAMSRWANNKIEFTRTAARLLGRDFVPHTESAFNFAMLSRHVLRLAATNDRLCIKFPYGTGGSGNFVIESSRIRNRTLAEVRDFLRDLLADYRWPKSGRVLIDVWETRVIGSPSVQTWIPARGSGEPVIEGLFDQFIAGDSGHFVGSAEAKLPVRIEQEIVDMAYLLAFLFQQLGYIGRCSFDLILIGKDMDECRPEFIECNARWGGTSIPMTLMNRLGVPERNQVFGVREVPVAGLCGLEFSGLLRWLGDDLFDPSTGRGRFVLFNPSRIRQQSAIEAIAIGKTGPEVSALLTTTFPGRLEKFVSGHASANPGASGFLPDDAIFETSGSWRKR